MIRTAIAELRRAFRGVTKRSVENRGKFGGVAHDAGLIETVRIQCFANGADAAVHHVAGRNHVGAGARVGKRRLDQKIDRLVVEDVKMIAIHPGDPAMTVAHVFAETHIGQHDYLRTFFLDCAQALSLMRPLLAATHHGLPLPLGGNVIHKRLDPGTRSTVSSILTESIRFSLEHRAAAVDLCADKKRQNEIMRSKVGLANQIAQSWRTAQAAGAMNQFSHPMTVRVWRERRKVRHSESVAPRPDLTGCGVPCLHCVDEASVEIFAHRY